MLIRIDPRDFLLQRHNLSSIRLTL